ncbi:MAG: hypothetical protein JNM82_11175 [Rhodocyclaceae bacterium]|nr:hypothetical protein [Rhodocyclaceae bacterium]
MLQGDPSVVAVAYVVMKAVLAIVLWGAAAIGHLRTALNWFERLFSAAAAFMLVVAVPLTDEIGFAMSGMFLAWHWLRSRQPRTA